MNGLRGRLALVTGLLAASTLSACAHAPGPTDTPVSSTAVVPSAVASSSAAPPPPAASASAAAPSSVPSAAPPAAQPLAVPLAVVVENAPAARPQSGLDQADIVWEILAEGFITRFFAIFATQPSTRIGPVRSARIYFDQLDKAYGLPYAHAGGNADALDWIGTWHLKNLDEIYGSGPYFWRSSGRQMPDNLYTSTNLLEKAVADRQMTAPPLIWPAKGALTSNAQPTSSVTLTYYNDPKVYTYIAGWNWSGGRWVRTVNGRVQVMTDGRTLTAGTVIVLVVPDAPDRTDPNNPLALYMLWNSGGAAWVLRDGRRDAATWAQGADGLPVVTAGGQTLGVAAGPYWYEVVPTAADVAFS